MGDLLIGLRARRDWSQADLAGHIGVTVKNIGHYEHGRRYPRHEVLDAIANLLRVPVGKLYSETRKLHRDPRKAA